MSDSDFSESERAISRKGFGEYLEDLYKKK